MKKHILLLLFVLAISHSCQDPEINVFGESPSARMENRISSDLAVLKGAENGWLMKYYPEKRQAYGGYNVIVKFEDNDKVTVASEHSVEEIASSSYRIMPESGPVLTFDDHNKVFHFFSDPKNSQGIGAADTGLGGDYEFIIIEAKPEQVILKGKKTSNRIVMTPVPKDQEWKDVFLKAYKDFDVIKYYTSGELFLKGESVASFKRSGQTFIFAFKDSNAVLRKAYIKTEKGLDLYEDFDPLDPNKKDYFSKLDISSFEWDAESESFISLNKDVDAQLKLLNDFYEMDEILGDYTMTYHNPLIPSKDQSVTTGVSFVLYGTDAKGVAHYGMKFTDDNMNHFPDLPLSYNKDRKMFEIGQTNLGQLEDKRRLFILPSTGRTLIFEGASKLLFRMPTKEPQRTLEGITNGRGDDKGNLASGFTLHLLTHDWKLDKLILHLDNVSFVKK